VQSAHAIVYLRTADADRTHLVPQEFKDSEFYITGESYAGQYIPTLMDQIHTKGGINLKGAAVGNGVGGGPTARGDRIRTK
jgi:carboxypeptidase C (cathepsin A)